MWTRARQLELRRHLLAWDPIGVGDTPEARDEYDCLISPLMHRLHDGASAQEIAAWLGNDLEAHFSLPADPHREAVLATMLVDWWRARTATDDRHGQATSGPEAVP